jgi:predicted nuclease of predicted toxin-antitoxin system
MRFLANENISGGVILGLRNLGHDVLSAKESMPSASDEEILAYAESQNRIVVTHDKDFGEDIFGYLSKTPKELSLA